MLSPKQKRNFLQVIPFGILSSLFGLIYVLLEQGILGDSPIYPATGNPYSFALILPVTMSFIFGIVVGTFEMLYLNKWFQKSSFLKKLVFKTAIYMLLILAFTFVLGMVGNAYILGVDPSDKRVWINTANFFSSFAFWSIELYITFAVIICLFYAEVSDSIGQGVLLNFFTGKYHHPVEEERIFMFLDMKSSTTIAEKLGHVEYFKMLKKYYADLSDPIVEYGGEIYMYVGDEVIVTWKYNKGYTNDNCLKCFFAMRSSLRGQAEKYKSEFGVIPTFKAGIHLGKVTTGEIGVIKKEITFSGDVLNTTARIQGLCNDYDTDLLTSKKLVEALNVGDGFRIQTLGEAVLRGRNEKISLCRVVD